MENIPGLFLKKREDKEKDKESEGAAK
jgi:23S rRNA (adenine1618-N6)-methyltransferase